MTEEKTPEIRSDEAPVASRPVVVSEHPEKFGPLAQLFLFIEERKLYEYRDQLVMISCVFAGILSIPIILYTVNYLYINGITTGDWQRIISGGLLVDIVKILMIYALIGVIGALVLVFKFRSELMLELQQAEEYAYLGRDMTKMYMPIYREQLRELNAKIGAATRDSTIPTGLELAKDLVPLVSLLLKKEPNMLKWGLSGLKVYRTLSSFLRNKGG